MGETCGMKLVWNTNRMEESCKLCEKIETKIKRQSAEIERIKRWSVKIDTFLDKARGAKTD